MLRRPAPRFVLWRDAWRQPEQVFKALREMVAEAVEAYQAEGKPLPMCTSARIPTLSLLHFTLDGDAGNSRLPCELELGYHGLRRRMT